MNKVQTKIAGVEDLDELMELRKEFIETEFGASKNRDLKAFYQNTENYLVESLEKEEQSTCIAYVDGQLAGCAMLCYLHVLPTLDHPTGSRAHLMNVYVRKKFRRLHIGTRMLDALMEEGRKHGVTEISLDATEDGRKLYEHYGYYHNTEAMAIKLEY